MWQESDFFRDTFLSKGSLMRGLELSEAMYWGKLFRPSGPWKSLVEPIGTGVACSLPDFDILAFNRVIGMGEKGNLNQRELEQAISFFKSTGAKRFMIQLPPDSLYDDNLRLLKGAGFWQYNRWVKLFADISTLAQPVADTRKEVVEVKSHQSLLFGEILQEAFGWAPPLALFLARMVNLPGYHCYFVKEKGQILGAGALHVEGDFASMAMAATGMEHRGKGVQTSLLQHRLEKARALNCSFVVAETGEPMHGKPQSSYANLQRIGLTDAYLRPNFVYQF
jgi:ribosomal protein S18 acetylase RimI-like enzyme